MYGRAEEYTLWHDSIMEMFYQRIISGKMFKEVHYSLKSIAMQNPQKQSQRIHETVLSSDATNPID